jgi:hypothetical protein
LQVKRSCEDTSGVKTIKMLLQSAVDDYTSM